MAEPRPADIAVAPLSRALLEGVDDGSGGARRRVDLAVLPCFEDERPLQGLAGLVDWRTSGSLSALVRSGFCTGAAGEVVLLPGRRTLPMERVVILGLGPSRAFDRAAAEATGERLVALVEGIAPRDVLVAMPGRAPERTVVEAVFDGLTRALARRRSSDFDAQAQLAAKAVGDESSGPVLVDAHELPSGSPGSSPPSPHPTGIGVGVGAGPGPRPILAPTGAADDPAVGLPGTAEAPGGERSTVGGVGGGMGPGTAGGMGSTAEGGRQGPAATEGPRTARASEPDETAQEGPGRGFAPRDAGPEVCRWWVVADPRHEARLRRLLEGPPRAAEPGA